MSTPNFSLKNTSKYFVIEINNDFDYEIEKENIQDYLSEHGYDIDEYTPKDDNRSYPSRVIASKTITKQYCNYPIDVEILIVVRAGYYAHMNLDYSIKINGFIDSFIDEIPLKEWLIEDFEYLDYSKGFSTIQAKNVLNFIEKSINILKKEAEFHFSKLSQPYKCIAVFSNGEALYEKV